MIAQTIPLYPSPDQIPNSIPGPDEETTRYDENGNRSFDNVRNPTMTILLPPRNDGASPTAAVIICPGGSYFTVVFDHEGTSPAKAFQKAGVAVFVLKYRLPDDKIMVDKSIGALQDAQQALKIVRTRAKEWNIYPNKIGILGFSAGGHLASTASTHFQKNFIDGKEDDVSLLRPDFQILLYPVISMREKLTHIPSRTQLLGENPTDEAMRMFSNDEQITEETPKTFLVHAADDRSVVVGNSISFFEKLNGMGVPAAMHIFERGDHGFGLENPTSKDSWLAMALNWIGVGKQN